MVFVASIARLLGLFTAAFFLFACTAQEKALVHELEDMPGVTCEVGADDQLEDCHPDTLEDSSIGGPPLNNN